MAKLLASILILAILVAGCTGISPNQQPVITNYHTGTDGLVMNFMTNEPASTIKVGSDFDVGIQLRNQGPWPINNGQIKIDGLDDAYYFQTGDSKGVFNLPAKGIEYPDGGYDFITFQSKSINLPITNPSKYFVGIDAIAIYDYGTEASANVCINPDLVGIVKSVCQTQSVTLGSQGAPVAVSKIDITRTSIDQNTGATNLEFAITVANKGKGIVSNNAITLTDAILGQKRLDCTPTVLTLQTGRDNTITCKTQVQTQSAYISPIQITLTYTYIQQIGQKLTITP